MTPEQARDLFSAAHESDLSEEERRAFDAALAADAALADEYQRFVRFMEETRRGALRRTPVPNLLPKVQERIRKRSRGRFFRDRFAERGGQQFMLPMLAGAAMLVMLAALWVMSSYL